MTLITPETPERRDPRPKPYLFLQGTELIAETLDSHSRLLQLLPRRSHSLVVQVRGHFGIVQLKGQQDGRERESEQQMMTEEEGRSASYLGLEGLLQFLLVQGDLLVMLLPQVLVDQRSTMSKPRSPEASTIE